DQAPFLGGGIIIELGARRNFVAGRNLGAFAVAGETPMVIGTAHVAVDQLAAGEIGADMRAIGALHHGFAAGVTIKNDPGAKKRLADELALLQFAREMDRVPGLVIVPLIEIVLPLPDRGVEPVSRQRVHAFLRCRRDYDGTCRYRNSGGRYSPGRAAPLEIRSARRCRTGTVTAVPAPASHSTA